MKIEIFTKLFFEIFPLKFSKRYELLESKKSALKMSTSCVSLSKFNGHKQ